MTRIRLAQANEDVLACPLRTAWMKACPDTNRTCTPALGRSFRRPLQIGARSCEKRKAGAPLRRAGEEYQTATHHLRTTQVDPEPLFAGQVTQIGTELDDLAHPFFHGMVNSIDNGIRLRLSKSFFEHVAEGLHVGLLLEVCPIFAGQG